MKRYLKQFSLSLFLITVAILPFEVRADISSNVSLTCDKNELNYGDSTYCYINLSSQQIIAEWNAELSSTDNLSISEVKSLHSSYSVTYQKNVLKFSATTKNKPRTFNIVSYESTTPTDGVDEILDVDFIKLAEENGLEGQEEAIKIDKEYSDPIIYWSYTLGEEVFVEEKTKWQYLTPINFLNKINGNIIKFKVSAKKATNTSDFSIKVETKENCSNKYLGDINQNGYLTAWDGFLAEYCSVKNCSYDKSTLSVIGDINNDDEVNATDSLYIYRIINGIDNPKYICFDNDNKNLANSSSFSFNGINKDNSTSKDSEEVNVPDTGVTLSILFSILSVALIVIGIVFIFKTKKTKVKE